MHLPQYYVTRIKGHTDFQILYSAKEHDCVNASCVDVYTNTIVV